MHLQGKSVLYTVTTLTGLSFCLIGLDNGILGGIINQEPFQTTFGNPNPTLLGTMVAIVSGHTLAL